MKYLKKLFGFLLALCVLTAVLPTRALAAGSYSYTVRIYAGGQGIIVGQGVSVYYNGMRYSVPVYADEQVVICENVPYGARVDFNISSVQLLDDSGKYYVKGIRESGLDNNTVSNPSIYVTQDIDYVVAYGILGSSVAYTVNYVDTAGNELYPTLTFYGNIGDKPVIAYQYVEGYQPQAYNLTRTLSENAAENVFTFVYTRIPTPTAPTPSQQPGGTPPQNPGTSENPGTAGKPEDPGTTENPEITDAPEESGTPENPGVSQAPANSNEGNTPAESTPPTGPQDIIDLDDPNVPLAGPGANQGSSDAAKMSVGTKVVIGGAAAVTLGVIIGLVLFFKRKKEKDSEEIEKL